MLEYKIGSNEDRLQNSKLMLLIVIKITLYYILSEVYNVALLILLCYSIFNKAYYMYYQTPIVFELSAAIKLFMVIETLWCKTCEQNINNSNSLFFFI